MVYFNHFNQFLKTFQKPLHELNNKLIYNFYFLYYFKYFLYLLFHVFNFNHFKFKYYSDNKEYIYFYIFLEKRTPHILCVSMWWGRNAKQVMAEYRERQNIQIKKQSVYLKQSQVLGTRITDKYKSKQFLNRFLLQTRLFMFGQIVYIK